MSWTQNKLDCIDEYCAMHKTKSIAIGDWGIHVPDWNLLFYKSTTCREIHNAFEYPPTRLPTVCFTDGSGTTADKPAGIGVVIYTSSFRPQLIAENIGLGTNNVAELRAIWRALQAFPDLGRKLLIQSDSEYAIGSLTKPWNGTANAELIQAMRADLALRPKVKIVHVDGHSGIEGQEIADQLANIGRKLVTHVSL